MTSYITNLYGHEEPGNLFDDISSWPIEKLRSEETAILCQLEQLRQDEPSSKHQGQQKEWFNLTHLYLDRLKVIRDAITSCKTANL